MPIEQLAAIEVDLTWVAGKMEHRIVFGKSLAEHVTEPHRKTITFPRANIFAVMRWAASDLGLTVARLEVMRGTATPVGHARTICAAGRGSSDARLRLVRRAARHQADRGHPSRRYRSHRRAPEYWLHVANRLAAGEQPRGLHTWAAIWRGSCGGGSRREPLRLPHLHLIPGAVGRRFLAVSAHAATDVERERLGPWASTRCTPPRHLKVGDLVAERPPAYLARYMAVRRYLPLGVPLLKYRRRLPDQTVCRHGSVITIDGLARRHGACKRSCQPATARSGRGATGSTPAKSSSSIPPGPIPLTGGISEWCRAKASWRRPKRCGLRASDAHHPCFWRRIGCLVCALGRPGQSRAADLFRTTRRHTGHYRRRLSASPCLRTGYGPSCTVESGGKSKAVSPKGAMGLMQIMPATWGPLRLRYRLGRRSLRRPRQYRRRHRACCVSSMIVSARAAFWRPTMPGRRVTFRSSTAANR